MRFGTVRRDGDGFFELCDRLIDITVIESRAAGGDQITVGGRKGRKRNQTEYRRGKLSADHFALLFVAVGSFLGRGRGFGSATPRPAASIARR